MTNDRLKEMIPDLETHRYIGNVFCPDREDWEKQTENLRMAVKHLIQCNKYLECIDGHNSMGIEKLIEQITGKKYSEI